MCNHQSLGIGNTHVKVPIYFRNIGYVVFIPYIVLGKGKSSSVRNVHLRIKFLNVQTYLKNVCLHSPSLKKMIVFT